MYQLNTYKKKKIATLKNKDNDFQCYLCFFISILVNDMYFLFLLFANTHHDHKLIRVKHLEN